MASPSRNQRMYTPLRGRNKDTAENDDENANELPSSSKRSTQFDRQVRTSTKGKERILDDDESDNENKILENTEKSKEILRGRGRGRGHENYEEVSERSATSTPASGRGRGRGERPVRSESSLSRPPTRSESAKFQEKLAEMNKPPSLQPSRNKEDDDDPIGSSSHFLVIVAGQIESCEFPGLDSLYCRYQWVHGNDWTVLSGIKHGMSQYSTKSTILGSHTMTWSFPLEISFKSTNAHGWPQLALSVYGPDWAGNDVVWGYGSTFLPIAPGRYVKYVRMFTPISSSLMAEITGLLTGQRTEFNDPKFVCGSDGRQVTRVRSYGMVKVQFNVLTRDMAKFGYTEEQGGVVVVQ